MMVFLAEHPEFNEIYARVFEMLADRKELLKMLMEMSFEEDIVASINATNESLVKKYAAKIEKMEREMAEKDRAMAEAMAEKDRIIEELSSQNL